MLYAEYLWVGTVRPQVPHPTPPHETHKGSHYILDCPTPPHAYRSQHIGWIPSGQGPGYDSQYHTSRNDGDVGWCGAWRNVARPLVGLVGGEVVGLGSRG